ncbi:MAG: type II toxin-antitoxin system VapC family toxin [Aliidongia sp.]
MKLLLDTHIFIWACAEPEKLSHAERDAIAQPGHDVLVSSVTAWEIAIKRALGRIGFAVERFEEFAVSMGIEPLPITTRHAIVAGGLPRHHDDPFDRMLIAQAQLEGATLMTSDVRIPLYDVPIFDRNHSLGRSPS